MSTASQGTESYDSENRSPAAEIERALTTWLTSAIVHLVLLCVLALFVAAPSVTDRLEISLARPNDAEAMLQEFEISVEPTPLDDQAEPMEEQVEVELLEQKLSLAEIEPPMESNAADIPVDELEFDHSDLAGQQLTSVEPPTEGEVDEASLEQLAESVKGDADSELSGRSMRRIQFSTPELDYSIDKGLNWLARHQLPDGGWNFDHRHGECRGRCSHPGTKTGARIAATGLALMPFLGAGHSPEEGDYREVVAAGTHFLMRNMGQGGSLWQPSGQMYGHGIATLALCECYGILAADGKPDDGSSRVDLQELKQAASRALYFIVQAQARDGGWRYSPGQAGDTSVVGWQIMALKSGADAGLEKHPGTLEAADLFLDAVQTETAGDPSYGMVGITYSYQPYGRKITPATTAIGLTCRMYMGISPFHPGMEIAIDRIVKAGPIPGDMYYNYYANQVVFQHGGPQWEAWSGQLNEMLMQTQAVGGHRDGSWHFLNGDHGSSAGGRLYATAMSCLCLEETFRHLPTFRKNARLRFVEQLGAQNAEGGEQNAEAMAVE